MLDNPFNVQPGTFFICGPVPPPGIVNPFFDKTEKHISEKNYPVFNPEKNVQCKDLNRRLSFLVMCDFIVTLPEWENCSNARNEVAMAKSLGKTLIFSEAFDHWDSNRKNLENASA